MKLSQRDRKRMSLMILLAIGCVRMRAQNGQTLELTPSGSQTITHPAGTSLTMSEKSLTDTPSFAFLPVDFTVAGHGFNLGNNGSSAQGWSVFHETYDSFVSATRGISQMHSSQFGHYAQGDSAHQYDYDVYFGGNVATSDEGITDKVAHVNQVGYWSGALSAGGTTGSSLVSAASIQCTGYCAALAGYGGYFPDGGILLDTSKGGATATIASLADNPMGAFQYTLATGTVQISTAWGKVVPNTCTPSGNGQYQAYTVTTCNVVLGTAPASPGSFVAGQDVYLNGSFQEEAEVTAVGRVSAGVQAVTFKTRYAWNFGPSHALMMQGGPGGQAFVSTGGWPAAYWVVGATSPTTLLFSNCLTGSCHGNLGGNLIRPASVLVSNPITMTASGSTVTAAWAYGGNPYGARIGSPVVVGGCKEPSLNGTFTVTANTYDWFSPSLQWTNAGAANGGAGCTIASAPPSITFYPSAFITGTHGAKGTAELAANTVRWSSGDTIVGAPATQYQQAGINLYIGQTTGSSGSNASRGVTVDDEGPSQLIDAYVAQNNPANGAAADMFKIQGSYGAVFAMRYRPANNGTILYVNGAEPVSANTKPYYLFQDNQSYLKILANPGTDTFTVNGPWDSAAGSTVGGSPVCTAATGCRPLLSGTTKSIGGSALTAGTCANGTATVPGATVGHTVGVAATDGTLPNPLVVLSAAVTAKDTVSVQVCAIAAVTLAAKSYNVTSY
jgi:hypothetical protein